MKPEILQMLKSQFQKGSNFYVGLFVTAVFTTLATVATTLQSQPRQSSRSGNLEASSENLSDRKKESPEFHLPDGDRVKLPRTTDRPRLNSNSPQTQPNRDIERWLASSSQRRTRGKTTLNDNRLFPFSDWVHQTPGEIDEREQISQKNTSQSTKNDANRNTSRDRTEPNIASKSSVQSDRQIQLTLSDAIVLALASDREMKKTHLEKVARRSQSSPPRNTEQINIPINSSKKIALEIGKKRELPSNLTSPSSPSLQEQLLQHFEEALSGVKNLGNAGERAQLQEQVLGDAIADLEQRTALIDAITEVTLTYNNLLHAQAQNNVETVALGNLQSLLESRPNSTNDRALLSKAKQRVDRANNAVEQANHRFLRVLKLDPSLEIIAIEEPTVKAIEIKPETLQQSMELNRSDYLQLQLEVERAKLTVLQAKTNLRRYANSEGNSQEELGSEQALRKTLDRGRINLQNAEDRLVLLDTNLNGELTQKIEELRHRFQQVEQAKKARIEIEKHWEAEREHGENNPSNGDRVIQLHEDLVEAVTAELEAIVLYSHAIAQLNRTLGNTLNTWGVTLQPFLS